MPIKELQQKYPYINWLEYINAMLAPKVQVDENERVINDVPTFFKSLGEILQSTPKRVIANYFMGQIALSSSDVLTDEIREKRLVYRKIRLGQLIDEPRWKECVRFASSK